MLNIFTIVFLGYTGVVNYTNLSYFNTLAVITTSKSNC